MPDDLRFTEPLYTVRQAALFVGMPPSTLAAWAHGYTRRSPDRRRTVTKGPVITHVPPAHRGAPTIPFIGLVEAMVVQAFRETQLPLQRIRKALDVLAVRPEIASGEPLFVRGGAPLSTVVSRRRAGESVTSLAADYGVPTADVEAGLNAVLPSAA